MATITRIVTGYPARAVRTSEFLYIRNLRPDRWPAGDPELVYAAGTFGDCDESPTKQLIVARRDDPQWARYFELCFAKRPAEELYDLRKDPAQTHNVAGQPEYAAARLRLRGRLEGWMKETGDPRAARAAVQSSCWICIPRLRRSAVSGARRRTCTAALSGPC